MSRLRRTNTGESALDTGSAHKRTVIRQAGRVATLVPVAMATGSALAPASPSGDTAIRGTRTVAAANVSTAGRPNKKLTALVRREAVTYAGKIIGLAKDHSRKDTRVGVLGSDTTGLDSLEVAILRNKVDPSPGAGMQNYLLVAKIPYGPAVKRGPKPGDLEHLDPHKVTSFILSDQLVSLQFQKDKADDGWTFRGGYVNDNRYEAIKASTQPTIPHELLLTTGRLHHVEEDVAKLWSQALANSPDQSFTPSFAPEPGDDISLLPPM